jgi:hypothetical protein
LPQLSAAARRLAWLRGDERRTALARGGIFTYRWLPAHRFGPPAMMVARAGLWAYP